MSAPLPTWIPSHRAMGVIARAMQTQRGFEPAVLEALADGSIRTRRRIDRIDHPFEEAEVTELAPEFWRSQKGTDPWGPWAAYSDYEVDPWAAYSDDERVHEVSFEFHYATLQEWLSPTKTPGTTRGRPTEIDWDAFWIEAVLLADTNGLPGKQAAFVFYMQDLYKKDIGRRSPSKTMIKEKASLLYRTKKAKAGK